MYKERKRFDEVKKQMAIKIEECCIECLTLNERDLNALFILLYVVIDISTHIDSNLSLDYSPKFTAEDLAVWAKDIDQYKGYLAWVEVYLSRKENEFAVNVLKELIEFYPENQEAYFKLHLLYKNCPDDALEVAEQCFLMCTNFYCLEIKMAINLMYSNSLFKAKLYIQLFEFLQGEFNKFPVYSVLLYHYGKYIAMSESHQFFGSGIGALQECRRVCIPERIPKINYYLGIYYLQLERHGKACSYFTKSLKTLSENSETKLRVINEYLVHYKKFNQIVESTNKLIQINEKGGSKGSFAKAKLTKIIESLDEQKDIDPITITILKSDVYSKMFRDKTIACKELKALISEFPNDEDPLFKYWMLLKELGNINELEKISNLLIKVCSKTSIPTNSWVESLFKHSETLVIKGKIEEAIRTLKKICYILPPLPIPGITINHYNNNKQFKLTEEALENIRKAAVDPIKLAQELDNFNNNASMYYEERISKLEGSFLQTCEGDSFGTSIIIRQPQNRMSSSNIKNNYQKNDCVSDFGANAKSNEYLEAPKTQRSYFEYKDKNGKDKHNITDYDMNKSVCSRLYMTNKMHDKQYLNESYLGYHREGENGDMRTSAPRISNMFGKISYISGRDGRNRQFDTISRHLGDSVSESVLELNYESQGFAVQSDLKFLYQIGRICAESGKYLEEGMLCLDDYINLINFFYPTETQQSGRIYEMKTKAIYMVGLIFYQVKDYEECIKYLTEVKDDLLEIDDIEKYYKCEQIIAEINEKKFY